MVVAIQNEDFPSFDDEMAKEDAFDEAIAMFLNEEAEPYEVEESKNLFHRRLWIGLQKAGVPISNVWQIGRAIGLIFAHSTNPRSTFFELGIPQYLLDDEDLMHSLQYD